MKLEGRNVDGFPVDSIKITDRNYRMTFAAASLLRTCHDMTWKEGRIILLDYWQGEPGQPLMKFLQRAFLVGTGLSSGRCPNTTCDRCSKVHAWMIRPGE